MPAYETYSETEGIVEKREVFRPGVYKAQAEPDHQKVEPRRSAYDRKVR